MSFNRKSFGMPAAVLLASGLLTAPAAHAQWTGKGELGLLVSRGNADATSANAKLDLAHEAGAWKNAAFLGMLYGENSTFATAQRVEARWQTNYATSDRMFWFGALRGEQDRFSGFNYQATLSTGGGYKFIDTDTTKFTGTLGAGFRRAQSEELIRSDAGEVLDRIRGETTGDAVGSAGLDYSHQLTDTTKVVDKFLAESGSSNTSGQNDIAVQVSMTEALALSVAYGLRYNTAPPAGAKKLDQLTTVNLVYNIK